MLELLGLSLALLTALLWGATSLEMRKAMVRLPAVSVTVLTSAMGFGMGLVASLITGSGSKYVSLSAEGIAFAAVAGLLVFALGRFLWYIAIHEIGASRSNSVVATEALLAPLASVTVVREGFGPLTFLGSVLVVLGVWLVYKSMGNRKNDDGERKLVGIAASVGAAFVFAFGSAFARLANLAIGSPTVTYTFSSLAALLGSWPFMSKSGGFAVALRNGHAVLGGLFNSLASFSYWGALSLAPVPVVVPASQTFPVFTVVLSLTAYKGSERVDVYTVLGSLLTSVGVVLVSFS